MNEVLALGETRPTTVDVRFIAASQLPLAQLVAAAQFRADLRARLEGLTLELPPLRERRSDVCPLFLEFMTRAGVPARCQLDARVIEQLCLHDWPMNVRELEAVANRLMTLHGGATELGLQHLRDVAQFPPAQAELPSARNPGRRRVSAYDGAELEALLQAVERHRGNLTKASQELGISRPRAYRMLRAKNRIGDP
jgi:transcriptional regulator with PAS, ATPase and Fis domain